MNNSHEGSPMRLYNGPGKLPVMGWTSQYFGSDIDEIFINEQVEVLIDSGMAEAGYKYVIIHDGWCGGKDKNGIISANESKFPHMTRFVSLLNKKGLKVGLYVTVNADSNGIAGEKLQENCNRICNEWGIEFLSIGNIQEEQSGREIAKAIRSTGKEVVIDFQTNGFPGPWVAEVANQWSLYDELYKDFYELTRNNMDNCINDDTDPSKSVTVERAKYVGPGHYYNIGIIPVGQGMTDIRDQAIFSEYCIFSCPIITGIDMTKMSETTRNILTNKGAIAINQDPLGTPGICGRYYDPWHCLYIKKLSDGSVAFLMLNRCHGDGTATIEGDKDLNISQDTTFEIFDVCSDSMVGEYKGIYSILVESSDKMTNPCSYLYKVTI